MSTEQLITIIMTCFTSFVEDNKESTIKDLMKKAKKDLKEKLTEALKDVPLRQKKLKDPEAPKKAKNAYMFFCDDHRAGVKDDGAKGPEVMKELGKMWKELDEKGKAKYEKKAEKAKKDYKKAMESYERPSDEELAALDVNKPKKSRGKKGKKDGPKKTSGYNLFVKEMRPKAVKKLGGKPAPADVMKQLGKMWKDLGDGKEEWQEKAKKLNESQGGDASDKKVPGKLKKKKDDDEEEEDEEEEEEEPKAKGKAEKEEDEDEEDEEDEDEEDEEEPKPKGKEKGKAKKVLDDSDDEDSDDD